MNAASYSTEKRGEEKKSSKITKKPQQKKKKKKSHTASQFGSWLALFLSNTMVVTVAPVCRPAASSRSERREKPTDFDYCTLIPRRGAAGPPIAAP